MTAWYGHDPKLDKAFAEGYAGVPATNPHGEGSDAYTAYAAGAAQAATETPCSPYGRVAACSPPAGPANLSILSTLPADDDVDVAVAATITVTFSHELDAESWDDATLTLTAGTPPVAKAFTKAFGETQDIVIITPTTDLAHDTEYTLTIAGVTSAKRGQMEPGDIVITFTTSEALTVLSTVPDDEATDVAIDATVTITFSHLLDENSFDAATLTLTAGTPPVAVDYEQAFGLTNDIVIVTPDDDLVVDTEYTLTISGVVSAIGGEMLAPFTSTFTTVAE